MLDSVDNSARSFALDGYSDIRQVGAGGMATVYSATQTAFQRKVAIKVLQTAYASDPEFAQRFLREAQTVSKLSHPHIIPVYDFGQKDGTFYMVMDFMSGGDLSTWIKRGLEEAEVLKIMEDIASALHFAHEKGFVHRDVKPDNVMFREDNSAVLTDFGIARKQSGENAVTVAGQILGTPKYMSPEQLQGRDLDGRCDIYALGIMFYEMLCRKVPYDDPDFMALATMHIQAAIPQLPGQLAKYQKLFERMVAKQPEHRFQSALEVVKIIQKIRSGQQDAASIDSGIAAAIKKAMGGDEGELAGDASVDAGAKISRNLLVDLRDLDPLLDTDWNQTVSSAFAKLTPAERKFVYAQILKPKGIIFDAQSKKFNFFGRKTVAQAQKEDINSNGLQQVAAKLLQAEQTLRSTRDTKVFADLMEGSISAIDRFNAEDNLAVQREKNILRSAFLDDLALIVRNAEFDVPPNKRSLTVEGIRSYMLDVFIRQQMIGYRFKTVPVSALERDPHEYLRTVVAKEARTRQCDIVRTPGFVYLIGPVRDMSQNPFSIRRFLHEDESMGGQVVYFNVVPIPLNKIDEPRAQEVIQWFMSRIVTLERQLSQSVYNFVVGLEQTHEQYLSPLLGKAIAADGSSVEQVIEMRLNDFEKKVSLLALSKLPNALNDLAKTLDEFEYLFFSIRKFLIELACEVRDFAGQSAASFSVKAEELDMKMMSYIKLLEKRKDQLFTVAKPKDDDPTLDHGLLIEEIMAALEQSEQEVQGLHVKLREVIKKTEEVRSGFQLFMEKIFGSSKKKEPTPDEIQGQITAAKRRCLLTIIRIIKRYPKITVYLELEDIVMVGDNTRHYGIAAGRDGITKLPLIVTLNEDSEQIDIAGMRKMLKDAIGG